MSKLWELLLMNTGYRQILRNQKTWDIYQSRIQIFCSYSKFKFWITTEYAPTDLYIYLFGTKTVETIDMAVVQQTVVTLCCTILFKAIKQPQKCLQNRFHKIAETEINTESKQIQTKNKISYYLLHQHKSVL